MLNPRQTRHLRALAHPLKPVVWVGKTGITDALVAKVEVELDNHELIKVKILKESPVELHDAARDIGDRSRADVAQIIGHTIVLYRRRAEKPAIKLPD